jgi:hypothetical protein
MDWLPEQTSTPSPEEPQDQPTDDPESEETRDLEEESKLPEREMTEAELHKRFADLMDKYVQKLDTGVEKAQAELVLALMTDPHVEPSEEFWTWPRRSLSEAKTDFDDDDEFDWYCWFQRAAKDSAWEIYRLWLGKGPYSGHFDGASDDLERSKSAVTKKRRHTDETEREPSTLSTALNGERKTREHKTSQTSETQAVAVDGPDILPEQNDDVTMWYKGCILTGSDIVEKAHVVPSYLTNNLTELGNLTELDELWWKLYRGFWPKGMQHTWKPPPAAKNHENIVPLSPYARSLWDANEFGLRPISSGTSERMYVQMYWLPPVHAQHTGRKSRVSPRPRFILDSRRRQMEGTGRHSYPRVQTGDVYELVTDDPVQKPLPNIDLLILRYTLLRVLETFRKYVTKAGLEKELRAAVAVCQAEIADLKAERAIQSSWELPPELEETELEETELEETELEETELEETELEETELEETVPKVPQECRGGQSSFMDKFWDGSPPHLKPLSSNAPEAARLTCFDEHFLERALERGKITFDEADKWRAGFVTWETEKILDKHVGWTLQELMGLD